MIYLIAITYYILLVLNEKKQVFPDGERYFSRERLTVPFSLRWLLRDICGQSEIAWRLFQDLSVILIPIVSYYYFLSLGFSDNLALIGGALVCGLNGVILVNYALKYMSDGFGMLCMVTSLWLFKINQWELAVLVTIIGSMANEKVFIYTALISLNPYALIGGIVVLLRFLIYKHAESDFKGGDDIVKHPLKAGYEWHKGYWFDIKRSVLVWGITIIAIANMNIHLAVVLAVAYGSVLLATDSTRLIMWAFPIVISSALPVFPIDWSVPLIAVHWFNPYRVNCI